MDNNKIIIYQDDNEITRVSVRFADEDLWLTQKVIGNIRINRLLWWRLDIGKRIGQCAAVDGFRNLFAQVERLFFGQYAIEHRNCFG